MHNEPRTLRGVLASDPVTATAAIERGFSAGVLAEFITRVGLPLDVTADVLRIPLRTLKLRRAGGRLTAVESDRLYRFAALFETTAASFGRDRAAAKWFLTTPAKAFGGRAPLQLAKSTPGARAVEALLGQCEHGVFP